MTPYGRKEGRVHLGDCRLRCRRRDAVVVGQAGAHRGALADLDSTASNMFARLTAGPASSQPQQEMPASGGLHVSTLHS